MRERESEREREKEEEEEDKMDEEDKEKKEERNVGRTAVSRDRPPSVSPIGASPLSEYGSWPGPRLSK